MTLAPVPGEVTDEQKKSHQEAMASYREFEARQAKNRRIPPHCGRTGHKVEGTGVAGLYKCKTCGLILREDTEKPSAL